LFQTPKDIVRDVPAAKGPEVLVGIGNVDGKTSGNVDQRCEHKE